VNSKKQDEIYQQYEQHIKAFDQDYRALLKEMEETDKQATYFEEQFKIQSEYLWRAVDLVKEYASFVGATLADEALPELPQVIQVSGWKIRRDALQERASKLKKDLSGSE
jgi:hypothetical protein